MTVSLGRGGAGGSRLVTPTARSTRAARGIGRVTARLTAPSPSLKSTTRTHLSAVNALVVLNQGPQL
jgi:hypothetical protein